MLNAPLGINGLRTTGFWSLQKFQSFKADHSTVTQGLVRISLTVQVMDWLRRSFCLQLFGLCDRLERPVIYVLPKPTLSCNSQIGELGRILHFLFSYFLFLGFWFWGDLQYCLLLLFLSSLFHYHFYHLTFTFTFSQLLSCKSQICSFAASSSSPLSSFFVLGALGFVSALKTWQFMLPSARPCKTYLFKT